MEKKLTVMVIEDEKVLLDAIVKKLGMSGMEPISCANGTEAIERLEKLKQLPDIIWLDYYLTDMEGDYFVETVSQIKEWKKIPVVVVSNSANPHKVKKMYSLGVKKYLLKAEYRLDDIINIIKNVDSDTRERK